MQRNEYEPFQKPKDLVKERIREFPKKLLRIHPWAKADTIMWRNIAGLWQSGHQVMVYTVDAPNELTSEWLEVWKNMYPCAKKNWPWWVQIYLRERIMANNMEWILKNYKLTQKPITLIFLQSFHWNHVKFLLKKPPKSEIWKYYFEKFNEINQDNVGGRLKNQNKTFGSCPVN